MNQDEIFCLIGNFLNRLKPEDWATLNKNGIKLQENDMELIITDKVRGRIAKELSKIYEVKEK